MTEFLTLFYNLFVAFFSCDFVVNIYLIVLAGLGLIYIIKSFIFIGRKS